MITGYFASVGQAEAAADFVARLKARNPGLLYLCDPVIGDDGGLYVSEAIAEAVRDRLLPLADIATPNRFELGWLAGAPLDSNAQALDAALALGPRRVMITSAVAMMAGGTGNLLLTERHALMAEHRMVDNAPNGLGDLTASLFLSRIIKRDSDERALQMATASVFEILARAVKRGSDELMLAEDHHSFSTRWRWCRCATSCIPRASAPHERNGRDRISFAIAGRLQRLHDGRYSGESDRYRKLAEKGQTPTTMVIACCDSRAAPETIFDSGLANCSWCAMSPISCRLTRRTKTITAPLRRWNSLSSR